MMRIGDLSVGSIIRYKEYKFKVTDQLGRLTQIQGVGGIPDHIIYEMIAKFGVVPDTAKDMSRCFYKYLSTIQNANIDKLN